MRWKVLGTLACAAPLALCACSDDAVTFDGAGAAGSGASGGSGAGGAGGGESLEEGLDYVYPQDRIPILRLDFAPGDFEAMLLEYWEQETKSYYHTAFQFDDDEVLEDVGVRLKGNSSLRGMMQQPSFDNWAEVKKPLKINFDELGGPRFHGVDRINLANQFKDPSYMRERLGAAIYLAAGVPTSRNAHFQVWVNGELQGLYTGVQQVDPRFLTEWFGSEGGADEGNLYKCYSNCDLEWQGSDREAYAPSACPDPKDEGKCGIQLKTNEDDPTLNDYADLVHFIDVLNNASEQEFADAIAEVFDVDIFLRYAAATVVLASLDTYFGRIANYYLYHRPSDGRFMVIPWDLNETFGAFGCGPPGGDLTDFDPYEPWCDPRPRPLVQRILEVDAYLESYLGYIQQLLDTVFSPAAIDGEIAVLKALIEDEVQGDPRSFYSYQAFLEGIGHNPSMTGGPMSVPNLGYFTDQRCAYLEQALP